jgi:hypothetical protein
MFTAILAKVSRTRDPNAAEVSPEDFHHSVSDLFEFLLQFGCG